jgi:hypothetical protein
LPKADNGSYDTVLFGELSCYMGSAHETEF